MTKAITLLGELDCACHPEGGCPVWYAIFFPGDPVPLGLCRSCFSDREAEFSGMAVHKVT